MYPNHSTPPTIYPSPIPSTDPTASPIITNQSCDDLYVDISDFNHFTDDELNTNTALQSTMADITHDAIAESATASGIHASFNVDFEDASGALFITFSLCASEHKILGFLYVVIHTSSVDISDAITAGLVEEFDVESDSMTVTVSLPEFGFYFEYFQSVLFFR